MKDFLRRPRATGPGRARGWVVSGVACAFAFLLGAAPARASWPTSVSANLPVCVATGLQSDVTAIADGAGGTFVAWADSRFGPKDVYVQHVSASGTAMWRTNGLMVGGATNSQDEPALALDGTGGVIVVWRDLRGGTTTDLYAQRVNAAGTAMWTLNGVPVCTAAEDQVLPAVIPTVTSSFKPAGVIVAWEDYRAGVRIYAQRLAADGSRQWGTDGLAVSTSLAAQFQPVMCPDGTGGALIAWSQQGTDGYDVAAQHLSPAGAPLWSAAGAMPCASTGMQIGPRVLYDGAGGGWFVWEDGRGAVLQTYAQRIDADGLAALAVDGVPVAPWSADQFEPVAVADGLGGLIVAWHDLRAGGDIYAQNVDKFGVAHWAAGGIAVSAATGIQQFPTIAPDGEGGVIVAWEDQRSGGSDIWAQRLGPGGDPLWPVNGLTICNAAGAQYSPIVVSDQSPTGVVVWTDQRVNGADIYAQDAPPTAWLGVPPPPAPGLRLLAAPNPSAGGTALAFTLPRAGEAELALFDGAGRRVRTLARGPRPAGAALEVWDARDDAGRACANGVYFARLVVDGRVMATRTIVLLR